MVVIFTHIKGPTTIREYDEKCKVNFIKYPLIVKYSKVI